MTKEVYNKLIRIKSELDRKISGAYSTMDLFDIIIYVDWCKQYHKAPDKVLDTLILYIIAVQDGDSDQIDKYYAYDIKSDMEAYKPRCKYQVKMRSKKPYSSWAVIKTYNTESAAKAYAKKAIKSHFDMVYKVFQK